MLLGGLPHSCSDDRAFDVPWRDEAAAGVPLLQVLYKYIQVYNAYRSHRCAWLRTFIWGGH